MVVPERLVQALAAAQRHARKFAGLLFGMSWKAGDGLNRANRVTTVNGVVAVSALGAGLSVLPDDTFRCLAGTLPVSHSLNVQMNIAPRHGRCGDTFRQGVASIRLAPLFAVNSRRSLSRFSRGAGMDG
jgi:hypothetical protein